MREYRAYILEIDGRRFIRVKDFLTDQPDDATAISAARQLVDGHDVELWDCGRLVVRLSADGEIASPGLAPFMMSSAETQSGAANHSAPPQQTLAPATLGENHLLLGW